ncbi:hypothetical protein NUH88_03765 [Nisaea acidiphila]|uniref:Peptidase S8/S53 domain-containing protein n=1 Tax=Nisaea acidiphila TaxID=1862145 RepID=A0A9J7AU26_9PROT|nr:hypothetical protein [Nisaea acidiphila]UUX50823.1 hypothetical protein NUH88_03765 [Nisaea acidiphila]
MTSEWKYKDLPSGACANLQNHWLQELSDDYRPVLVLLRLTAPMAEEVLRSYTERYAQGAVRAPAATKSAGKGDEFSQQVVMSHDSYTQLKSFVEEKSDGSLDLLVVLGREGYRSLLNRAERPESGISIVDFGVGLDPRTVGTGSIVEEKSEDRGRALDGDEVIVAIVDDGIAFANDRFRRSETETRFEYFYAMDTERRNDSPHTIIGQPIDKLEIDELLRLHEGDEERVYRASGLIDFGRPDSTTRYGRSAPQSLMFARTHGTHILDVASGYDWRNPEDLTIARKRPLIGVQLPAAAVAETSGSGTSVYLRKALQYIGDRAIDLSRRAPPKADGSVAWLPLVVNFSFGISAGPLDGGGPVEREIQNFIRYYKNKTGESALCRVVLPSGNSFHSRSAARMKVMELDPEQTLKWRLKPDDRTASFVDIWLPEKGTSRGENEGCIQVSLEPPRGGPKQTFYSQPNKMLDWVVDGVVMARIYHRLDMRGPGRIRENVLIAVRGTEPEIGNEPVCPSGNWRVRIARSGGCDDLRGDDLIELRVQRDDPRLGQRPKGRQSYFDDAAYEKYDPVSGRLPKGGELDGEHVSRRGSFNAYANLCDIVVVGGYRRSDGEPSWYTGSGPTMVRTGPDLAAVSEESPSHIGVIASGTFSGSVFAQNGTSVAVPAKVRALANEMAPGGDDFGDYCAENGPHGPYGELDQARLGNCRLHAPAPPNHRRRIEPE